MKINTLLVVAAVAVSGCSSSSNPTEDDIMDGAPLDQPLDDALVDDELAEPEVPVLPTITMDNFNVIVRSALGIFTGDSYGPGVTTLPDYSDPAYANDWVVFNSQDSVTCSNGGTAELESVTEGFPTATKTTTLVFDNCQDDINIITGDFTRVKNDTLMVSSTGIVIDNQNGETAFSGEATLSQGNEIGGGPDRLSWHTQDLSLSLVTTESAMTVDTTETYFQRTDPFSAIMGGSFTFSSPETGDKVLTVVTTEEFRFDTGGVGGPNWIRRHDWNFETGSLTITAEDGSEIVLSAANLNFDTVAVKVTSDGEEMLFDEPWSTWSSDLNLSNWLYDGDFLSEVRVVAPEEEILPVE